MNTIYRLVWNSRLQAVVVVPEIARGKTKGSLVSKVAAVVGLSLMTMNGAYAVAPIGTGATSGATNNVVVGDNAQATNTADACGPANDFKGVPFINGGCAGATVIGNSANNNGFGATTLLGDNAQATGTGAVALGGLAKASQNALAAGFGAQALNAGSIALGSGAGASANDAVALGHGATATRALSIALGAFSSVDDEDSVALGAYAKASGPGSVAVGSDAQAGNSSTSLGLAAKATGSTSTALGVAAIASGQGDVAVGAYNNVSGTKSGALGGSNTVGQDNTFVMGNGVTTSQANSVVLGNASTDRAATTETGATLAGTTYTYAGQGSAGNGVLSVGKAGAERQVINVAAGKISATSTDAVNGSQLFASSQAINTLNSSVTSINNGGGIKYFHTNTTFADSQALSEDSIAIGPNAIVKDMTPWAIAIGRNAVADANVSIAIGSNAVTTGAGNQIAIGTDSKAYSGAHSWPATSLGYLAEAKGYFSTALGATSKAIGENAVGIGGGLAMARNATGLGKYANAVSEGALAVGYAAWAKNVNDVALGNMSLTETAVGTSGATIGGKAYTFAAATPNGTLSIGGPNIERTITNVAAGRVSDTSTDGVNGSQLNATNTAVNLMSDNLTTLNDSSVKYALNQDGTVNYNTITLGGTQYDVTNHTGGTVITNVAEGSAPSDAVNFSQLTQTNSRIDNVYSSGTKYFHANSTGTDSDAQGLDAVAIGLSAIATNVNDVALGANSVTGTTTGTTSVTLRGTAYTFAGTAPTSQVSVGSAGNERLVTNVAAGSLSDTSTDAVNGSQLNATNSAVNALNGNLTALNDSSVKYALNQDGTVNYNTITLGGTQYDVTNHTGGTVITNVAEGSAPSDAVNFSQLTQTNSRIDNVYNSGTKYFHANSTGADSSALGQDAVAIGTGAAANHTDDVALGANSVTGTTTGTASVTLRGTTYDFAGATPASQVSVGSAGNERLVTNVAAGSLSDTSTDAVNGSQLNATNTALNNMTASLGNLQQDALQWDSNTGGFSASHSGNTVNRITNVARGDLSSSSTDAVNGSQLYETNQKIDNVDSRITNVENTVNNNPVNRYTKINSTGDAARAEGQDAVAMGQGASASGKDTVAMGNGAAATADNAVALGAKSVADRENTVSVGAKGKERQLTNLAQGTEATDAVNVAQLREATGDITTIRNTEVNIANGREGMLQVNNSSNLGKPVASGNNSLAGGLEASASGNNSTALGTKAIATADNSIALGNGSVADRENTLSVGSVGKERQIANVAEGTRGTDAANVNQVNKGVRSANQYTDKRFNDLKHMVDDKDNKLSAGIAGAMAMASIPQPYSAGASMVGLGGGTYQGESAVALGVSTVSDNGKWVTKLSGTTNSQGDFGAAAGIGYQW